MSPVAVQLRTHSHFLICYVLNYRGIIMATLIEKYLRKQIKNLQKQNIELQEENKKLTDRQKNIESENQRIKKYYEQNIHIPL